MLRSSVVTIALLGALSALVALPAAASAARGPSSVTTKAFDVRVSGEHTVRWGFYSTLSLSDCTSWSVGKGELTATYAGRRASRYELMQIVYRKGMKKRTEYQWGVTDDVLPRFEITQEGEWEDNNGMKAACTPCGPGSEYGPCQPDPPEPPAAVCPKRKAAGVVDLTYFPTQKGMPRLRDAPEPPLPAAALLAEVRYSEDPRQHARCYPEHGGEPLPLKQPAALLVDAVRLSTLARGATHTFTERRREYSAGGRISSKCGAIKYILKMSACASTEIKLVVKRVR